ncbi:GcrA family cell cycle regulator [Phenylobacterium sp.]|uniref:GcrA family cell cycle regulator n=1 Tax=Phenylobacterium sp. TaxID=1871053 RepID=UPI003561A327
MSLSIWTPERVAILERLWTDGLSASEIAARFPGITRNAVLGKLHRLGRLGRGRPMAPAKVRKAKPPQQPHARRPHHPPTAAKRPPPVAMPIWAGQVARVEALRSWHCRWPIGDPHEPGFAFCGRRVAARPYCGDHRAVAYQPASTATRGVGAKARDNRRGQA